MTRKFRLFLASLLSFGWLLAIPAANAAQGLNLEAYDCGWYYNQSPPQGCNTTGQSLGVVPYINFNDGSGGPLGVSEDYQYHWFGYLQQTNGLTPQFRVCSDDGMRLYIGGQLIVDNWYDRGGQCGLPVSYAMTNNNLVPIEVWFYENGGGSNGSLQWNIGSGFVVVPSSVFSTSYVAPAPYLNAPTNLSATIVNEGVSLSWSAPVSSGTAVERYAIGWETADGGWAWSHDQTSITVDYNSLLSSSGLNKSITFKIRADNDSLAVYSAWSNTVTIYVAAPYVAAPLPFNYTYRVNENEEMTISAPSGQMIETITAWYGDPNDGNFGAFVTDVLTAAHSGETTTVIQATNTVFGDPVPGTGKILIANATFINIPGPTPEEIAAQQEAESETARQNAANSSVVLYETATITSLSDYISLTTLKNAAQSLVDLVKNLTAKSGFQSRIDYKSASVDQIKAKLEADQAAAVAEAARIEAERLAAIAAAKAAAEEQARLKAEAEAKAAAEAAAKAEEERIKAEEEAKAKAEEEERLRIEAEKKAEEERIKAEQEAKEKAEAEAKAEEERLKAEAEEKAKAEAQAKAEEEKRLKEEAEQKAKEEAEAKAKAEEEAKKLEEEKKKLEEEAKAKELEEAAKKAKEGKELTEEQKEIVVEALIENLKPGEAVTAAAIAASGVSYSDLPPETPVELRTDASGNEVIITAEVAAQVELISDPAAFAEELFSDPGAALAAFGSIGADMSEEERKESTEAVVATVVAAGAAINAVAATGGSAPSGGSTGGGNSGGSGNGSTGSRRNEKW